MRLVRKWILRRILRSARLFERQAVGLYGELWQQVGNAARGDIGHLVEEERMHQKLLEDVVAGALDDRALEQALAGHRYHALDRVKPLDASTREAVGERLERALRDEEATARFYENLGKVSTLPGVKLAFRVLADMEREHVEILRRLLGQSGANPGRREP